jgi:2-polyprenyl-6-methoxyphenol hydroxylase-like FAD-dependent oxidoreductase
VKFGKFITKEQIQIHIQFNHEKHDEKHPIVIDGKPYDLVILADGGFSSLRSLVTEEVPHYAGYICWRGSVTMSKLPTALKRQIQEGVYKDGHYDTIVLKMAKDSGEDMWTMGSFIATPEQELSRYQKDSHKLDGKSRHDHVDTSATCASSIPDWFQDHFHKHFSHVPGLPELIHYMIQDGEIKPHPQYEFGATKVRQDRILLVGDAAHMASPRTAVGAHSAILDALALKEAFQVATTQQYKNNGNNEEKEVLDRALQLYTPTGVERAQALYQRSRQVSQQFLPS